MKTIIIIIVVLQVLFVVANACSSKSSKPKDCKGSIIETDPSSYVTIHNALRLQISKGLVPNQPKATNLFDLKYDEELEKEAAKISATCKFAHVTIKDSRYSAVGQNLFKSSNERKWDEAVQAWFDEHKAYSYPGGFSMETGHYTQVVWAGTKYVGCAYSNCDGFYMYVCNYGPSGNYDGEKPYETE